MENTGKLSEWRLRVLERLDITLVLFELVLSVAFLLISYYVNFTDTLYFRGVGVGLTIAWVTSGIAYIFKRKSIKAVKG